MTKVKEYIVFAGIKLFIISLPLHVLLGCSFDITGGPWYDDFDASEESPVYIGPDEPVYEEDEFVPTFGGYRPPTNSLYYTPHGTGVPTDISNIADDVDDIEREVTED